MRRAVGGTFFNPPIGSPSTFAIASGVTASPIDNPDRAGKAFGAMHMFGIQRLP